MKFAQICDNRVHWIFEAEEKPVFAPYIVVIDITDRYDIQEGWDYNEETGEFSKPVITSVDTQPQKALTLEEIQENQLTIMNALADMYMDFMSK